MNVAFRVDAGKNIGIGHLMRCLAFSEEIIKNGGKCYFLSRIEGKELKDKTKKKGAIVEEISNDLTWDDDCRIVIDFCKKNDIEWVVTDHYDITTRYIKKLKEKGLFVLSIDDYANIFYYSDIVVNQNIGAEKFDIKTNENTKLLLGPKYVILRDELIKTDRVKHGDEVKNILITLGGSDKNNVASKIVESIKSLNKDISYKVIVGPLGNKIYQEKNIKILYSPKNMAEIYSESDIAISSGGTTCYELLYFGIPNIIITIAENQINIAENLDREKTSIYVGERDKINFEKIIDEINQLIIDKKLRREMIKNGMKLIDGKGKERILKEMGKKYKINKKTRLRVAKLDDAKLLWKLRNELSVRKSAFDSEIIDYSSHLKWYKNKLKNPDTYFYIAMDNKKKPIGMIRFDKTNNNTVEVDVSVEKNSRNMGYGSFIIKEGCHKILKYTEIENVISRIKKNNIKSIKTFSNAGFKIINKKKYKNYEIVEMEFEKN